MAKKPYCELTPAARRRVIAASVLRSVASVTLLVGLYYAAPLDGPLRLGTLVTFGLGLLAFAGVTAWQVRAITRSDVPKIRAVQALATGVTMLLVLYAALYSAIAYNQPDSFTQTLSRTDGLYYTVTVFATVGFGDITPRSELARIVTTTQMLFGLVVFGLVVRTLLGAVQVAVRRREGEQP
jgi:voltage-gated potassium channel